MAPDEGRRWALVVLGPPLLLFVLAIAGYILLFAVPGSPCHGAGDLTAPQSDVVIAANDTAVTATHVGGEPLDGASTDRVVLAVRKAGSDTTTSTQWVVEDSVGSTVTLTERQAGFQFDDSDVVSVRWYGKDPDVAGFCPNGRTISRLAGSEVGNASTVVVL
jgi:hypothetical protein